VATKQSRCASSSSLSWRGWIATAGQLGLFLGFALGACFSTMRQATIETS